MLLRRQRPHSWARCALSNSAGLAPLRAIWGDSAYRDPRAIDVHIRHLREKLEEKPEEPQLILTVRGAGYRFQSD